MEERMKLKIMTWNINGAAALGWDKQSVIKKQVVDAVVEQKADVIVLTEFVVGKGLDYLFERLHNEEYIWFTSSCSGKNGILIAIKENLLVEEKDSLKALKGKIYEENRISSVIEDCNILKVTLPLKCDKELCIIGCRMEVSLADKGKNEYDCRRTRFDQILVPQIPDRNAQELCIVCGDFNNAMCHGNLKEKFNEDDYKGLAQKNYNLNIIKDKFDELGFTMADNDNGEAIQTWRQVPEDHIFIKGFQLSKVAEVEKNPYSDHDILFVECTFE